MLCSVGGSSSEGRRSGGGEGKSLKPPSQDVRFVLYSRYDVMGSSSGRGWGGLQWREVLPLSVANLLSITLYTAGLNCSSESVA